MQLNEKCMNLAGQDDQIIRLPLLEFQHHIYQPLALFFQFMQHLRGPIRLVFKHRLTGALI